MAFVHLDIKTGYSFMKSTIKIPELIKKAKEDGMESLAITDAKNLHGAIQFYKACKQASIKPIIGIELTVDGFDREQRIIMLAKNNEGYQNLLKLSTKNQKELIPLDFLLSHANNCVIILPFHSTQISQFVHASDDQGLVSFIEQWPDHTKIGVSRFDLDHIDALSNYRDHLVAIGRVVMLDNDDYDAYRYLLKMESEQTEIDEKRHYLFTQGEAETFFHNYPELIERSKELADECKVTFDFDQQMLPRFPIDSNQSAIDYLKELTYLSLEDYYSNQNYSIAKKRLDHELSIIHNMGFSDYFLIVWDFVRYAKEQNILVGPGRGSAAGSLVAYLLNITEVDPIEYDLLFERFLNPERVSMPDIDIDFLDYRRHEVIEYVKDKYGEDYVAQIGTFSTFKARSIIRELAKAFDLNDGDLQFILKEMPSDSSTSIVEGVKRSTSLLDYIKNNQNLQRFFKIARLLEGLPRNLSTHAAGIVMHDEPLVDHVPLTLDSSDAYLTQYPMEDLEQLGLLKMDFLGLRNLTTIENIMKMINRFEPKKIDLNSISLSDPLTLKALALGDTVGVFQLESEGMQNVLKQLKPSQFEDVVAVNALYRPGPMAFIDTYIKRKHNEETTEYLHDDLKPIISKTYGVLIYQEQIMQLANLFAGFSYAQADLLRRAISKKKKEDIDHAKLQFVEGCLENGYQETLANELFAWIERFADYGFNRSHAVAYSMISFQLAYFKANYPVYFYTELLNTTVGQAGKRNQLIKEAKRKGIELLKPDINRSFAKDQPEKGNIRLGLLSIKGLSYPVIQEVLKKRSDGPYQSLFDFCLRVSLNIVNRQSIELLVLSGAFDLFNVERASLLATIDHAMEQGELFGDDHGEGSLLSDVLQLDVRYQDVEPFSQMQKLLNEKELLGMYVSHHPLGVNRHIIRSKGFIDLYHLKDQPDKSKVHLLAGVQSIRQIRTKRGESMAFVLLTDETDEFDSVLFPDVYRDCRAWLKEEQFVKIEGTKETRQNKDQIIVRAIEPIDMEQLSVQEEEKERLFIKMQNGYDMDEALLKIQHIVDRFPGSIPIYLYKEDNQRTYKLSESYFIDPHYKAIQSLKAIFNDRNVVLKKAKNN
ncbi:DNA polymerase-3 subunit alpha [Pelagirhabdus alkalitolerans]|uniref:DNA polymerase III subunit alpha n=1 Tax=Pelagirhabdus alkalitolerans TaxID=1612202 RepID=A0A1G6HJX4_9BACI|nr:DNA polymerase III subunit alpha [Pelagirhabdus alkalitolerans]SDB94491.1 DNA polymerase-3 subunit alpha [Pelagirhabdus alkalitolerans]